jgi:hypothetical protein
MRSVARVDARRNVHSKPAHAADLGTAGALLAGTAVLFVLAGGLISFHGVPSLSDPSAPAQLIVGAGPDHGNPVTTRSTRRLRALTAPGGARRALAGPTAAHRTGRSVAGAASPLGGAGLRSGGQPTGGGTPGGAGRPGSGSGTGNGPPILDRPSPHPPIVCTQACGGGGGPPDGSLSGVVDRVRQVAGGTVSHAGSALGGDVQQITGQVPSAGGAVAKVGAAAGGAISGTAGAVGSVLGGG